MSLMLANHRFFNRQYREAAAGFEAALRKRPEHIAARKKLVVCYAHTLRIEAGLELATGLLREGPAILLRTDPEAEGFPCGGLLEPYRRRRAVMSPGSFHAGMALLSLFCDEREAIRELEKAVAANPELGEARELLFVARGYAAPGSR